MIMDNTSYHSILSKAPTTIPRKYADTHIYWLQKSNIFHDLSHIRNELHALVPVLSPVNTFYEHNKIAFSSIHTVIHLPLYNPVELIWILS
jgi:hypothetical protein